ncbi:PadR family transcriptional regulator [Desulfurococcus amylolyticus]|uniref:Transcriptional regulator PadR family protein n=1 Tax=Desulfurococcus amylolyticus DSM 16532 TaxID=768672 RepID=I3XR81_DESAM|nr:PadR family transcriptional regulator [Desulfurococcus amylolyticus]AFL66455.1 transcriptional regulator PadR family protein [Desulfurococcus amylolyticus DSM 16532]
MNRIRHRGKYIELLILDMSRGGRIHGYYLLKKIREETGLPVNPGLIYPLLKDMVEKGLIKAEESFEKGRRKIVFRITEKGEKYLEENKQELEIARKYFEKLKLAKEVGLTKLVARLIRIFEKIDQLTPEQLEVIKGITRELEAKLIDIAGE